MTSPTNSTYAVWMTLKTPYVVRISRLGFPIYGYHFEESIYLRGFASAEAAAPFAASATKNPFIASAWVEKANGPCLIYRDCSE